MGNVRVTEGVSSNWTDCEWYRLCVSELRFNINNVEMIRMLHTRD